MEQPASAPVRYRFGAFEMDRTAAELRKRGIRIKLQEQPYRILCLLLESPGEVITREALCQALWPEGTFVEFERSLNAAVAKLRQTLGDSAENSRFVETVARRGYRFIAPVEAEGTEVSKGAAVVAPIAQAPPRRVALLLGVSGLVALGVLFAVILVRSHRPQTIPAIGALHRITSDAGLTTEPAVSRDGALLAYASDRSGEGHLNIWVQQLSGDQAIRLTHSDADDYEPSFSPDGTQVVFRSGSEQGGIYVVPSLGGEPRLIARQGRDPRFSPDGKWIAYWVGREWGFKLGVAVGRVYVVPSMTGLPRAVSTGLASAGAPVWSPDGKHLLMYGSPNFETHYHDNSDWWIIPVEGGGAPVRTGAYKTFGRQGINLSPAETRPYPMEWIGNEILFPAKLGDGIDIWRVPIRSGNWQVTTPAERLTAITGQAVSASATSDGRILFANLSHNTHLWSLPINADRAVVTGSPLQLTNSAAAEYWPSISTGGMRLAFTSTRSGNRDIWLKDLTTGKESRFPSSGNLEEFPKISPDGGRIAFTVVQERHKAAIYVRSLEGRHSEKVLEDGDWVWTWSPDGRYLLYKWGIFRRVRLLDLATGSTSEFLRDANGQVFQPTFSSDGRWIAFMASSGIFAAPYRGPTAIAKRDWIRIIAGNGNFDDKPRWSPDGARLYFTSDRDGSRCIWTQGVDLTTKLPAGQPTPFYHFHSARQSLSNVGSARSDIAIARDQVIFPQTELTGNVWMIDLRR